MDDPKPARTASQRHDRVAKAITDALALGLFYENELFAYVDERCAPHDEANPTFLGEIDLETDHTAQQRHDIEQRVAAGPRGTWALIASRNRNTSERYWNALISDGTGKLAIGAQYQDYNAPPSYDAIAARMRAYECYLVRKELREAAALHAEQDAILKYTIQPGRVYKNVNLAEHGRANRIFIDSVNSDTGLIEYSLTKRGSAKRYRGTMSASALVQRARLHEHAPEPDQTGTQLDHNPTELPLFA